VDSIEDKEAIKNLSLYRKFNRLENGTLNRGHSAPNVPLFSISGEMIPDGLFSLCSQSEKPLILVAGSIS